MNWKIALVVSTLAAVGASFATAGCGGDDCTRADDHFAECAANTGSGSSSSGAGMAQECSGARLCQSQCINQHTCSQITGNDPTYTTCLAGCLGK
jgi:hypothetical protein